MKINRIKKLKNDLYEISIECQDEIKKLKISEDFVIKYQLYQNKQISDDDLLLLEQLGNYSKLYSKTLNYISYKMRTEDEVVTYLEKKGCLEPYLSEIINKLKRLNYINDKMYADMYVKHQCDVNKKGPRLIQSELTKKNLNKEMINRSLQFITVEKINQNIHYLISYYDRLNKNKSIKKLKENILRNLMGKGYEYEMIKILLNDYPFSDHNNDVALLEKEVIKVYQKYQKKYQGFELKNRVIKSLLNKGFLYDDILSSLASIHMEG